MSLLADFFLGMLVSISRTVPYLAEVCSPTDRFPFKEDALIYDRRNQAPACRSDE